MSAAEDPSRGSALLTIRFLNIKSQDTAGEVFAISALGIRLMAAGMTKENVFHTSLATFTWWRKDS